MQRVYITWIPTKENFVADFVSRTHIDETTDGRNADKSVSAELRLDEPLGYDIQQREAEDRNPLSVMMMSETERRDEDNGFDALRELLSGRNPTGTDWAKRFAAKNASKWKIEENLLVQRGPLPIVYVPPGKRKELVEKFHEAYCHLGPIASMRILRLKFTWPKMWNDLKEQSELCDTCQRFAPRPIWRRSTIIQPSNLFDEVHCDHMGPLTPSYGYRHILSMIARGARWPETHALRTTSATPACKKIEEWFWRYGPPRVLICDAGSAFISDELSTLCEKYEVYLRITSIGNPEANGVVERFQRTLTTLLARATNAGRTMREEGLWSTKLGMATHLMRVRWHSALGCSPYRYVFGEEARTIVDPISQDILNREIPEEEYAEARKNLGWLNQEETRVMATIKQKTANEKRQFEQGTEEIFPSYRKGDLVLVYRRYLENQFSGKLQPRWDGPFRVKNKAGDTYELTDIIGRPAFKGRMHARRMKAYRLRPGARPEPHRYGKHAQTLSPVPGTTTTEQIHEESGLTKRKSKRLAERENAKRMKHVKILQRTKRSEKV